MDQIRDLLKLWGDTHRSSADVKTLTETHIAELEQKIQALAEMRDTLANLADACDGDHRPDCPIIDSLEGKLVHLHAPRHAAK
jgi:MerR family copper efflux transcriptional regulator